MGFMQSNTGGEDFKTFIKYNAKAGRWYTKEDKADAEEFEVRDMTAVFDFGSLRTGWFLFAPGVAPIKQLNDEISTFMPRPAEGFKQGFQINLFSNKNLLGIREFASTAGIVIDSMNELYDVATAAPEKNEGKLPVVKCTDVRPVTGAHGTNYAPVFQIVDWVARPPELTEEVKQGEGNGAGGHKPQADNGGGFDDDLDDSVPF